MLGMRRSSYGLLRVVAVCIVLTRLVAADPSFAASRTCEVFGCTDGEITGSGVSVSGEGGGSSGVGGGTPVPGEWDPNQVICPSLELQYPCFFNWHQDDVEDVRIADLRHFPAQVGTALMEPGGWTIVGLPTNFYAHAPAHELTGPVLGKEARVRFIPIRYFWDYGDGATAVKNVPGTTWKAQRLAEFSSTPTSHVYRRLETVRVRLSIEYAAAYRWAGSEWMPVIGTLTLRANDLITVVAGAETVLVDQTCLENAAGPGC